MYHAFSHKLAVILKKLYLIAGVFEVNYSEKRRGLHGGAVRTFFRE
jgi:hypothetical protein